MLIRAMTETDLDFCVRLVTNEGWLSESKAVFETCLAYDRHGCFIGEEDGQPLGMCIATAYSGCGFLGELIIVPDRRGHGLGRQLIEHAIAYLRHRQCTSIYLDGDTPAVPLYERLGFKTICRSNRFLGTIDACSHANVRRMMPDDLKLVYQLDREAFGADRSFFLNRRLELYPDLCLVVMDANKATGYLMGQPGPDLISVGPWLSLGGVDSALVILETLAHCVNRTRFRIGVLETNIEAVTMLRSLADIEEAEPSWRMVLGPDIKLGIADCLLASGSAAKG